MSIVGAVILSSTVMLSSVKTNAVTESFTEMQSPAHCLKTVESVIKTARLSNRQEFKVTGSSAYDGIVVEYRFNGDRIRRELTCITE